MRIAYLANSDDLLHGADRRRFVYFAKKESVIFEKFNESKFFDLLIVSIAANLHEILKYKKKFPKTKIVFDYCDDLLSDPFIKKLIRPLYESFKWKSFKNLTNFNNLVIKVLSISNIIICGSIEQKKNLLKYNQSIIVIPDFVISEVLHTKDNFKLVNNQKINFLWEGFSGGLQKIAKDLFKLMAKIDKKILLNIVTDPHTYLIGDRYIKINTEKYLMKMSKKYRVDVKFWSWSKNNLNKAIECSDLGIILIPKKNKIMQNKPENKLVLLSSFNLPVLVSSTPSYKRYIYDSGGKKLHDLSTNLKKSNIENLCSKESVRAFMAKCMYNYAIKDYSEEKILSKWRKMLKSFSI